MKAPLSIHSGDSCGSTQQTDLSRLIQYKRQHFCTIQYSTNSISSASPTPTVDRGRITQSVSVNRISQKLMIKSLWNCIKRLNIIEGPNRLCFEWLLPTQGQGCKRSKGKKNVFANNFVQSSRRESQQKLKYSFVNFLKISRHGYGRKIDSFEDR